MEHVECYLRASRRRVKEKVVCFAIDEQHTQIYLERQREREGERGGGEREEGETGGFSASEVYISSNKLRSFTPGFISPYTQERA